MERLNVDAMRGLFAVLAVAGTLLPAGRAAAQELRGARVRVTLATKASLPGLEGSRRRITGTLVDVEEDGSITVRVEKETRTITVPESAVKSFKISRGRRTPIAGAFRGAAIGALGGMLFGAVAGALAPVDPCRFESGICIDVLQWSRGDQMAIGALFFGALGGAGGAMVGLAFRGERWEEASHPLRLGLDVAPVRGGVGLRLSASF